MPPSAAPVIRHHPQVERRRAKEVAGGATAECAAICCCIPCAVMDMLVLATYKLPAGLVKKAINKRKQRRVTNKKKNVDDALLPPQPQGTAEIENAGPTLEDQLAKEEATEKSEVVELEKEMWARFNGTGFWRSSSQHETTPKATATANSEI